MDLLPSCSKTGSPINGIEMRRPNLLSLVALADSSTLQGSLRYTRPGELTWQWLWNACAKGPTLKKRK